MSFIEDIKLLCVKRGNMSQSELARRLGETPQNYYLKIKRNSLKDEDLKQACNVLNCNVTITYTDKETGTIILKSEL